MKSRKEINQADPMLRFAIQDERKMIMPLYDLDIQSARFNLDLQKLGLGDDLDERSDQNAEAFFSAYREPGYGSEGFINDYSAAKALELRQLEANEGRVPEDLRTEYRRYLDYFTGISRQCEQYSRINLRFEVIETILSEYIAREGVTDEQRKTADSLYKEAEALRSAADQSAHYKMGHQTPFIKFMEYCWEPKDSSQNLGDKLYSDPREVESFAQDFDQDGLNFASFEAMTKRIHDEALEIPSYIRMKILASDASLAKTFLDHKGTDTDFEGLTLEESTFLNQNFEGTFQMIYPKNVRKHYQEQGMDVFDLLYIDGQSLRERYRGLYQGKPYYNAVNGMKAQLMSEVLNGRSVTAAFQNDDGVSLVPVELEVAIRGLNQPASVPNSVTPAAEKTMIEKNLKNLSERSIYEKKKQSFQISQNKPFLPRMQHYEEGPVKTVLSTPFKDAVRTKYIDDLYTIYEKIPEILNGKSDLDQKQQNRLLHYGQEVFLSAVKPCNITKKNLTGPVYKAMGVKNSIDSIFIDGKPAAEFLKTELKMKPDQIRDSLYSEAVIGAILTGGEHHVDAAMIGMDQDGRFEVTVSEIQMDLHLLDSKKDHFYSRTRSHKAEKLFQEDSSERQAAIKAAFSEKMVKSITKQLSLRENPYFMEETRFHNSGTEVTEQYFGSDECDSLSRSVDFSSGLKSGENMEFRGCVTIAQLYLMSEHPEIRFADLMDPSKYQAEKKAYGTLVADAMTDYQKEDEFIRNLKDYPSGTDKEPFARLGTIMAKAVKGMAQMDLKKELLYALGQPLDLDADAMKDVMKRPEESITVSAMLSSLHQFGRSAYSALCTMDPHKRVQELNQIRRVNSYPCYDVMNRQLSKEEITDFMNARDGLNNAFAIEKKYMDQMLESPYMNPSGRVDVEPLRNWIAEDGKASHIKPEMWNPALQNSAGKTDGRKKVGLSSIDTGAEKAVRKEKTEKKIPAKEHKKEGPSVH